MKITKTLIVDSSEYFRELLKAYCSKDKEIEIIETFSNGEKAYSFIQENKVDAILIDHRFPNNNAEEIVKKISTNYPNITIVVYSMGAGQATKNPFEKYGVLHFYPKYNILVEHLKQALKS